MSASDYPNRQQFFHGTRSVFQPGDLLTPQGERAAKWLGDDEHTPGQHVYYDENPDIAESFAYDAGGYPAPARVYQVEPTARHEHDPHSDFGSTWRSRAPVRVIREAGNDEADYGRIRWYQRQADREPGA